MITKEPKKVLVADDSVFFRTKLSDILVEAGHRVRFARDGIDVINEIKVDPEGLDLLILDIQMPNIDGFGVLEWVNDNGLRGKFPILAVTGVYEVTQILNRLKELGATGVITKGFTPEQIVHRINMLLFPEKTKIMTDRRVPVSIAVDFSIGDKKFTGFLLNISSSGVFLHTNEELLPGSMVRLMFALPGQEKVFDIKGIVKWSTKPGGGKTFFGGSGLMFTSISNEDQEEIREFVEKETKSLGLDIE